MDYRSALHFYTKSLEKNQENFYAQLRLAKCYVNLNDAKSAEPYLRQLVNESEADIEVRLLYAHVLLANGKYVLSENLYKKLLLESPENKEIISELNFLSKRDYYSRNESLYEVNRLKINSKQSDFSPQYYNNGILFVSSRHTGLFIKRQPTSASNDKEGMLRYFFSPNPLEETLEPYDYGEKLKSQYHDGPLSFYMDNTRVAFTRNNLKEAVKYKEDERVNLKIFFGVCNPDSPWQNIVPFTYNSEEYSSGHPALNEEGNVMYFVSDMPGGLGGSDIYVTYFEGSEWSVPTNLGPEINTAQSEMFPYLQNDSTLVFASNGLGGYGGLDIFSSSKDKNAFSTPINLGAPLNSASDDFSLILDKKGRNGFFASNREGGDGLDDVYKFSTRRQFVIGAISVEQNKTERIENVEATISSNGEIIETTKSDSSGVFNLDLEYDQDYSLSLSKDGFISKTDLSYSTKNGLIGYDTLSITLWRHELYAKGRIFSNETQSLIQGAIVTIKEIETGKLDSVTTSADGSYTFAIDPDSKFKIEAKMNGLISNGFEMNTANLYKGDLLNDIVLEEIYVEKLVILFDFNGSKINQTYYSELNELQRTLINFPKSILNVTAHADARGTIAYNKALSEKRVKSITKYFTSKGVEASRINGLALGEELLLNKCSSGVECSEDDHSQNRRAELKVQHNAHH